MNPPIDLPLSALAPAPSLFSHASTLHGQSHVSRVIVHAFRLIDATGWIEEAPRLWAAVYLHDLARTHDGVCYRHGGDAMKKFRALPEARALFVRGGVAADDYEAIKTAVVHHCLPQELDRTHPHYRLTSLLKDADALDRVRLHDLDPRHFRNPEARRMVEFAHALFEETDGIVAVGDDHFERLWAHVVAMRSR